MCDFGPDGLSSDRSSDLLDGLGALTALTLDGNGER
jgi:phage terminase large subunit-like protein